jgi:hypothetical protein
MKLELLLPEELKSTPLKDLVVVDDALLWGDLLLSRAMDPSSSVDCSNYQTRFA